jgi:signal transduction histidine kinase
MVVGRRRPCAQVALDRCLYSRRRSSSLTLSRLKLLAIVAPLAFLTVLWTLAHTLFVQLHEFPWVLVLLGVTAVIVASFAYAVFAVVSRLEQRIVAQNRELEQRNEELGALLAVGRAASSSLERSELLDEAMAAILEFTWADAAEVWLQGEGGELTLAGHRGLAEEAFVERRDGEGLPGLAAGRGVPIVVHDLASDPRVARDSLRAFGFQSYCGLPLRHGGETVGVLGVAALDAGKLSSGAELRLLEGIAERLAMAIENSRLHGRVLDGAVLEERMRLARELHDGLAQVLGYINMQTHAIDKLLESGETPAARAELARLDGVARDVYRDVREEILGLRVSLPRQGLVPALRRYLAEYEPMTATSLHLEVREDVESLELPPSTEIQLVRIVQEALSNIRKHAGAASASVRLSPDGEGLTVEVSDDGRGFDPLRSEPTGWPRFGLRTMGERAEAIGGRLELSSHPGQGTRVVVHVPLVHPEEEPVRARAAG